MKLNPFVKNILKKIENGERVTIWFDIDGTLADTESSKYDEAEPDFAMITLVNMLYNRGCQIYLVSARGATSGVNWLETTEKQMEEWGIKYHKLIMGYPKDLYIGDEVLRPDEFLRVIK